MQLIGHNLVPFTPLYKIESIEDISKTPSQSTVIIHFEEELIKHCQENGVPFALHVDTITQAIIGNAAGAMMLIANNKNAKEIQSLADHYLFDAKIALIVSDEKALQESVKLGIDTAILPKGIV